MVTNFRLCSLMQSQECIQNNLNYLTTKVPDNYRRISMLSCKSFILSFKFVSKIKWRSLRVSSSTQQCLKMRGNSQPLNAQLFLILCHKPYSRIVEKGLKIDRNAVLLMVMQPLGQLVEILSLEGSSKNVFSWLGAHSVICFDHISA